MGFSNTFSLRTVDLIVAVLLLTLCWGMETRSSATEALVIIIRLGS